MTDVRRVRPQGHGSVMFNLRMQPEPSRRTTARDRERAMEFLLDRGAVPSGWRMAAIEWAHPSKGSVRWVRGGENDLDRFLPLLRDVGLSNLRMAKVETGKEAREPNAAERKKLSRWLSQAKRAGAKEAKAKRSLDRVKSAESRKKWRKVVAGARGRRRDAESKFGRLYESLEPEDEYEVAVDYRKKGRGR